MYYIPVLHKCREVIEMMSFWFSELLPNIRDLFLRMPDSPDRLPDASSDAQTKQAVQKSPSASMEVENLPQCSGAGTKVIQGISNNIHMYIFRYMHRDLLLQSL